MSNDSPASGFVLQRHVAATPLRVWRAWTEAEQLQQWFGPTGSTMTSCHMVFRPGGHFHYELRMPDGQTLWGLWNFRVIVPMQSLVLVSGFSDAARGFTRHPMAPIWPLHLLSTTTFADEGESCLVTQTWEPLDASAEERAAFDGAHGSMRQGWGGTFDRLDAYLASQP